VTTQAAAVQLAVTNLVGGEWVEGTAGESLDVLNPAAALVMTAGVIRMAGR
jgi:hypothetical protein